MKVNPVGIQSYQHLNRPEHPQAQQAEDKQVQQQVQQPDRKVLIEPQNRMTTSAVSVKAPENNYAENLSKEERRALELLFSRFRDASRFGEGNAEQSARSNLGQMVDIKV